MRLVNYHLQHTPADKWRLVVTHREQVAVDKVFGDLRQALQAIFLSEKIVVPVADEIAKLVATHQAGAGEKVPLVNKDALTPPGADFSRN